MRLAKLIALIVGIFCWTQSSSQTVPILNYSVNNFGQVELEIEAQSDRYYLLSAQHEPNLGTETITSLTLGVDGLMIISEPLEAYPLQNYRITEHSISSPDDTDGDGVDDIAEYTNMPSQSALNFAREIPFVDGVTAVNSADVYSELAAVSEDIFWAPFLNNRQFIKFVIVDQDSDTPEVFFINSNTHFIHNDFLSTLGLDVYIDDIVRGEIVYNPNDILPNGTIGRYLFNYSFGNVDNVAFTSRTFELLASNMPFLRNNFQHFVGSGAENEYLIQHKEGFEGSRIEVVLESELFADVDFIPLNQAEGYGLFRLMELDEIPGSRDIVLYETLPNSLPRVGGIITSVVQTPLSHVNLRAIQDNVPNAYIQDPLEIDSISSLIGKYIYYKVEQDKYIIREASLEEVNDWYENIRPTEEQIPDRDLSQTEILPLNDIGFEMSNAFGAKCSNVATMRNFGFPEGTIPDGFGVPFYFYDEFMKYNGFYEQAESMMMNLDFITDLDSRIEMLSEFRKEIRAANMPQWMLDELESMHDQFPEGTSVRCRSSTNNEDLPGFSGAGLYTSKTQHPDEGHISKSIKQVYASMWNFRAFDERDFYRVNHFIAAMGVLCHPNYEDEKSNGVGVSIDPIYQTLGTFYLNTQLGESLVTNPDANSVPEEILLHEDPESGYFVIRNSNLVEEGELVMDEEYLDQMRAYLKVIHNEFEVLYNLVGAEGFGMDIEYKVTKDDQLIIKQARPWVSFWAGFNATFDLAVEEITNPISSSALTDSELISTRVMNSGLRDMKDFELSLFVDDQFVETLQISDELAPQSSSIYQFSTAQDFLQIREYNIEVVVSHPEDGYTRNDTLRTNVRKLYYLEAEVSVSFDKVNCNDEIELTATISNLGESTLFNTDLEVIVNGLVVDTVRYEFGINYMDELGVKVVVSENLMENDNEIIIRLLSIDGQQDELEYNNSSKFIADLFSTQEQITIIINADNYPEETSWVLFDDDSNNAVAFGNLSEDDQLVSEDICVTIGSCYRLLVLDSYGDGICCGFGMGDFLVLNSIGDTIVMNDGDFGSEAVESFCLNEFSCSITADIQVLNPTSQTTEDGMITINPTSGVEPYQYSINGGQTFESNHIFSELAVGEYTIVVRDSSGVCFYEETIELEFISSVVALSNNQLKIYPNPTHHDIILEMSELLIPDDIINVELYNAFGALISVGSYQAYQGKHRMVISLKDEQSGSYFIKCYNKTFEKTFRVIKI